jgi:cell division protein FtsB
MTPDATSTPDRPLSPRRRRLLTALDRRVRRRRLMTYGVLAMTLGVMTHAVVGENGYFATLRARREQAEILDALTRVRLENQRLQEEIRRLREDPAALEEAARSDLGLMRPGETLVVVREAKPAPPDGGR